MVIRPVNAPHNAPRRVPVQQACISTLVTLLGATMVTPAAAQGPALEEIVVTARKRQESIQDIPMAITAFTSEEIIRRGLQSLEDVGIFTPGLNFEDYGGAGFGAPVIRGAAQPQVAALEQNVGVFFDGIYLPRGYVADLGFAFVERLEVVKGPQSARYGRNAFAGAINYVPAKPGDEWQIQARATAGNGGRYDAYGSVSGPIVEDLLSVRIAAEYSEFDGVWNNTHPFADISFSPGTDEDLGGWEKTNLHAGLRFTPTDSLQLDFSYYNFDSQEEHHPQNFFAELNADSQKLNCGQFNPDVRPPGTPGFGAGGEWFRLFCGEIPVGNIPIDPRGYARQLDTDLFRASAVWEINDQFTAEYLFGRIESNTFALGYKDVLPGCTFILPLCVFADVPIGDFDTDSHELRIDWDNGNGLRLSGGLYYFDSRDFVTSNFGGVLPLSAPPTEPIFPLDTDAFVFQATIANDITETEVWSPFLELGVDVLDGRGRVGVEVRWSRETKTETTLATSGGSGTGAVPLRVLEDDFNSFTPRFSFEYDLADDRLIYVTAAKGVRTGGFNGTATLESNRTFGPDQNWTYEIGSKNIFLDGRLQLNGALFYTDWTDVQIFAQDEGNPNPLSRSIIQNLGDIDIYGVEFDAAFAATEALSIYATLYYGDAEYADGTLDLRWGREPAVCDDVVCPTDGDIGGNTVARQSQFQASLGAEWRAAFPLRSGMEYYLRADMGHQSKQYAEEVNLAWVPARTLVNANVGLEATSYTLSLWARNLFDEEYVSSALVGAPNVQYNGYLGERRTWGLTLQVQF
jgi:iron complex outermembrane receptor protein